MTDDSTEKTDRRTQNGQAMSGGKNFPVLALPLVLIAVVGLQQLFGASLLVPPSIEPLIVPLVAGGLGLTVCLCLIDWYRNRTDAAT